MPSILSKILPPSLLKNLPHHRKKDTANKRQVVDSSFFYGINSNSQPQMSVVPYVYPCSYPTMTRGSLISQRMNFSALPVFASIYAEAKAVTFPDLNGNPLLQLHLLVVSGVLEAPQDKLKYNLFKNLIYFSSLDSYRFKQQEIDLFDALLRMLFPVKNKDIFIRWIGDIHAERISNDVLIMKVMSYLHENQISSEFIFGNHDSFFIILFHYFSKDSPFRQIEELRIELDMRKSSPCYSSLERLNSLINGGLVNEEDISHYIHTVYLPHLKILSYQKNEEGKLAVFSHGILINRAINGFIKKYTRDMIQTKNQIMDSDSAEKIIDKINSTFHFLLERKSESLLRDILGLKKRNTSQNPYEASFAHSTTLTPEVHPVHFMLWGRTSDVLKDYIEVKNNRYFLKPGADTQGILSDLHVTPIHGHTTVTLDRPEEFESSYWTIDSFAGKSLQDIQTDELSEYEIHSFCSY